MFHQILIFLKFFIFKIVFLRNLTTKSYFFLFWSHDFYKNLNLKIKN